MLPSEAQTGTCAPRLPKIPRIGGGCTGSVVTKVCANFLEKKTAGNLQSVANHVVLLLLECGVLGWQARRAADLEDARHTLSRLIRKAPMTIGATRAQTWVLSILAIATATTTVYHSGSSLFAKNGFPPQRGACCCWFARGCNHGNQNLAHTLAPLLEQTADTVRCNVTATLFADIWDS